MTTRMENGGTKPTIMGIQWGYNGIYPLVIQHSHGTFPIYRGFLMIYL
jgi:hypothetical protein